MEIFESDFLCLLQDFIVLFQWIFLVISIQFVCFYLYALSFTYLIKHNFKVGGLDSRDQLRSRSRTSFMSILTFENRRECPSCRDQLLKVSRSRDLIEILTKIEILGHKPCRDFVFWTVENVLYVETNFWKPSRMSIMSRSTYENRRDRESRSRPCRDKSRPPSLHNFKNQNFT